MDSARDDEELPSPGFPIRTPPDQRLVDGSPRLFAATRVLHRLSTPRHPPHALSSLVDPILYPSRDADRSKPRSRPYKRSGLMQPRLLRLRECTRSKLKCLLSFVCDFQRTSAWWSRSGSNRRPPACKAGALPIELQPRFSSADRRPDPPAGRYPGARGSLVGLGRLELPTSRLSGVRSNQLSYRPVAPIAPLRLKEPNRPLSRDARLGPSKPNSESTKLPKQQS